MRLTTRLLVALSLATFVAHPVHAEESWGRTVAAAKREGKVVVFGPAGEILRTALLGSFKKSYPDIRLEYAGGRAVEHATKIKAERDGGVYSVDVFIGGAATMLDLGALGALERLDAALILAEVREPRYWRENRLEFTNPATRFALVFSSQPNPPIIYHQRQAASEQVDELYELLDPKWKGKAVLNDPLPVGAGSSLFRWLWRTLGPDRATDFIRKLRVQAGAVDRDQRRQIEWVAQGKYSWLLGPNSSMIYQLAQRGLKFGILPEFKDYGTHIGTGSGCIALMNRAPRRNAALLFINWFLGREGQAAWSGAVDLQTRRVDISLEHIPQYLRQKAGVKYWISYYENDARRSPEEDALITELFGR
jgi:ABC-type Fe3+ transport system substrate-binding protein